MSRARATFLSSDIEGVVHIITLEGHDILATERAISKIDPVIQLLLDSAKNPGLSSKHMFTNGVIS